MLNQHCLIVTYIHIVMWLSKQFSEPYLVASIAELLESRILTDIQESGFEKRVTKPTRSRVASDRTLVKQRPCWTGRSSGWSESSTISGGAWMGKRVEFFRQQTSDVVTVTSKTSL